MTEVEYLADQAYDFWLNTVDDTGMMPAEYLTINDLALVQRAFAENLPVIYFAAPRLYFGHSARLRGVVPSIQRPPVLWNADSLSVAPAPID